MDKQIRIGIMGGTFNPIHIGHLIIGECAYEQFRLDKVWFMPSKIPPHKKQSLLASERERREMVELSVQNNPHFDISTVELERQGITYSVDTLNELISKSQNVKYYFIIGADSLFELPAWKNPGELLSLTSVLVASRNGMVKSQLLEQIELLRKQYGGEFHILDVPTIDISSSGIRNYVKNRKSIRYYVTDEVRKFIYDNGLYQDIKEGGSCG